MHTQTSPVSLGKKKKTQTTVSILHQHPHFLSEIPAPRMEWELLLSISLGESRRDSSAMFVPLRASSSRAMRVKATSTFWASLAEVSRTASTPLLSASVHASSNSTCLWAWRSDLLPARSRYHRRMLWEKLQIHHQSPLHRLILVFCSPMSISTTLAAP